MLQSLSIRSSLFVPFSCVESRAELYKEIAFLFLVLVIYFSFYFHFYLFIISIFVCVIIGGKWRTRGNLQRREEMLSISYLEKNIQRNTLSRFTPGITFSYDWKSSDFLMDLCQFSSGHSKIVNVVKCCKKILYWCNLLFLFDLSLAKMLLYYYHYFLWGCLPRWLYWSNFLWFPGLKAGCMLFHNK